VLLVLAGLFVSYYAWVEIQELDSGTSSRVVEWSRDVQSALQRWVERVGGGRLALAALIIIAAAVVITLVARSPRRDGGPGETDPPTGDPGGADVDSTVTH
jgi:hypothetical protein